MPTDETYFITWKGRRDGPYSLGQLDELLKNGEIGLLHRVETSTGQMTLKQLLQATAAERTNAKTPMIAGSPATIASTDSFVAHAEAANQEAMRAYTICGLCFLLPPLAYWAWKISGDLAEQGNDAMAQRLKLMSVGLASGGLLMWALLWRFW